MSIFFSEEYSGFTKKAEVTYIIKPKQGAVACATEEIYKNVQNLYLKDDLKLIEAEIKSKNCMLLESGEELEAYEGICDVNDENSVKLFKSKKVFLQKIYAPCFAVEMKKIIAKSEDDFEEKESEGDSKVNKIQQNSEEKNIKKIGNIVK